MWRPGAPRHRCGGQGPGWNTRCCFGRQLAKRHTQLALLTNPKHLLCPQPQEQAELAEAAVQDEGDELLSAVASAPDAPAPTPATRATDELEGSAAAAQAAQPEPAVAPARSGGSKLPRPPSRPSSRPSSASKAAGGSAGASRPASRSSQPGSRPGSRPASRLAAPPAAPSTVAEALKNLAQAQPVDPVADLNVIRAAAAESKDSLEVGKVSRFVCPQGCG